MSYDLNPIPFEPLIPQPEVTVLDDEAGWLQWDLAQRLGDAS